MDYINEEIKTWNDFQREASNSNDCPKDERVRSLLRKIAGDNPVPEYTVTTWSKAWKEFKKIYLEAEEIHSWQR